MCKRQEDLGGECDEAWLDSFPKQLVLQYEQNLTNTVFYKRFENLAKL
jgi:hypothetical protein